MNTPNTNDTPQIEAAAARQLLEHKALVQAFANLEKLYYDQWVSTPSHDIEGLTAIKSRFDGLCAFRSNLEAMLTGHRIEDFNKSRARLHNPFAK